MPPGGTSTDEGTCARLDEAAQRMRGGVSPKRGVGPLLGGGRRLRAGGRAPRAAAFSPSPTNVPHLRGTCPPAAARPTDGQGQARCAPSAPAFEQRSRAPAMPHQGARCAVSRRAGYRRTWCSESRRREPRDYVGGRQVATKPAPPALTTALCPRGKLSSPRRRGRAHKWRWRWRWRRRRRHRHPPGGAVFTKGLA